VAIALLGAVIARRLSFGGSTRILRCIVTETEAYLGEHDPASRASKKGKLRDVMCSDVGRALVYGVHRKWLFNVVAHEAGECGAVLIRSCEPFEGVDVMMALRGARRVEELTVGPGRLTEALAITKEHHGKELCTTDHGLWLERGIALSACSIASSKRIGVTRDLDENLRFYVVGSPFVSPAPRASSGERAFRR